MATATAPADLAVYAATAKRVVEAKAATAHAAEHIRIVDAATRTVYEIDTSIVDDQGVVIRARTRAEIDALITGFKLK